MSLINKISKFFRKKESASSEMENKIKVKDYLGKFVMQNGLDIGESIAFERGRIIVKKSDSYSSIPFEKITSNVDKIIVGDFDMEESLKLGKEWSQKKDSLKFDDKGMLILNKPDPQ
ncbi:Uncharacterised protein [uncultured archaeon]|nr:Uncharacterised protein [uncultured archaeon]